VFYSFAHLLCVGDLQIASAREAFSELSTPRQG